MRRCNHPGDAGRCRNLVGGGAGRCAAGHPTDTHATATLGATAYRGRERAAAEIDPLGDPFYDSPEHDAFSGSVHDLAVAYGVDVHSRARSADVWDGTGEPCEVITVHGHPDAVRQFSADLATRHNQDAVMACIERPGAPGRVAEFDVSGHDPQDVADVLRQVGLPGATVTGDGRLILAEGGDDHAAKARILALGNVYEMRRIAAVDVEFVPRSDAPTAPRATDRATGAHLAGYDLGDRAGDGRDWGTVAGAEEGLRRRYGGDCDLGVAWDDGDATYVEVRRLPRDPRARADLEAEAAKSNWRLLDVAGT